MNQNEIKKIINNEYDYSNILPVAEHILYLVEYLDNVYKYFLKLCVEDEEKNKQFKPEYKEYMFKKHYDTTFQIYIREKNYTTIECNDFQTFKSAIDDGNLKNVLDLKIKLNMSFRRGNNNALEEHENSFVLSFKPYEITFFRKSNYDDQNMHQIENNIKLILNKFQITNCIFCDK